MMKNSINKHTGFTLIELVIVIIILGILAATALPKFINVKSDAQAAAIQGVAASLRTIDNEIYAKSAILGIVNNDRDTNTADHKVGFKLDGKFISTMYGHPWMYSAETLTNLVSIDFDYQGTNTGLDKTCESKKDFCVMQLNTTSAESALGITFKAGGAIAIYPAGKSIADKCFAYHIFDRTDNNVIIGSTTTGC